MDSFVFQDWLILLITLIVTGLVVYAIHWVILLRYKEISTDEKLPRQLTLLAVWIVALVAIVLALPVSESSRNQLLALIGVLLSGMIAFSSTTIVSNLMAGVVLRFNTPFNTGDYIRCAEFSGRVTERGVLDTEIQTEQRTLIHIANSFLLTNPVEVVRSSGTFISVAVSIGYDVHHSVINKHLEQAAKNADLSDPFVHVTELGDFSVSYKVSGMLVDTKTLLTSRSNLHACVLDELHNNDIEIMSPNFIASRLSDPNHQVLAKCNKTVVKKAVNKEELAFEKADEAVKEELESAIPTELVDKPNITDKDTEREPKEAVNQEELAFDKADEAAETELQRDRHVAEVEDLKIKLEGAEGKQKETLKTRIDNIQSKLAKLQEKAKED